ncbi:MAG: holo-ACP synthase [bacterium]|nr:holo-ACP synthase [bacterium]
MKIKTGCDIVHIKKFEKSKKNSGQDFLDKIFQVEELTVSNSAQHLAGVFAAKEAVIKALGLEAGNWKQIGIRYSKTGHPILKYEGEAEILSHDISISHDGDYAIASAVFLLND